MTRSRSALRFGETLALDLVVGEGIPPAAEAIVVAQDVNMIMGNVEAVVEASEPSDDLAARLSDFQPQRAGSLVVGPMRKAKPLLLQAVVYDFDRTPPSWEEPVFEALLTAFEEAKARGFSSLAVRPLGTAHSGLSATAWIRASSRPGRHRPRPGLLRPGHDVRSARCRAAPAAADWHRCRCRGAAAGAFLSE